MSEILCNLEVEHSKKFSVLEQETDEDIRWDSSLDSNILDSVEVMPWQRRTRPNALLTFGHMTLLSSLDRCGGFP